MTDVPVCAWTDHATTRLGERFGSRSDKVKVRIEELIAMGDYSEIPDQHPADNKLAIRLNVRDAAVGLVVKLDKGRVVIITVLPTFSKRMRAEKWKRM